MCLSRDNCGKGCIVIKIFKYMLKGCLAGAAFVIYAAQVPMALVLGVKSGDIILKGDERLNCLQCDCTMGPKKTSGSIEPAPSNCVNCHDCGIDG